MNCPAVAEKNKITNGFVIDKLILKAIRNVTKLICRENNREKLVQGICDCLMETGGYNIVWIVLYDRDGKLILTKESGAGKDFKKLRPAFESGNYPYCLSRATKENKIISIESIQDECRNCPLSNISGHASAMATPLSHNNNTYGYLTICTPPLVAKDTEVLTLLVDVAEDIAYALHKFEIEEMQIEVEQALKRRNRELACLFEISSQFASNNTSIEEIIKKTMLILPKTWEFPGKTFARIIFNGIEYKTKNFKKTEKFLITDIIINGKIHGYIEQYYTEQVVTITNPLISFEHKHFLNALGNLLGNIIQRMMAEEKLKRSLEEEKTLLKEIHHRVKNNLQVILSLLRFKSRQTKDLIVKECLQECQNRLQTMALIHESLYKSGNLTKLNFSRYLSGLTRKILQSFKIEEGKIKVKMNVGNYDMKIHIAVPLALIVNELITNSIKHAFPIDNKGVIEINYKINPDDSHTLIIQDTGIGLPGEIDFENTRTLGLRLVRLLTTQLNGNIVLDKSEGTKFEINFMEMD